MEQHLGYFCRAYIGQDVQANVIARTLREAELEITRMIRGGAMVAHAVEHGWPDHEPVLVASATAARPTGRCGDTCGKARERSSTVGTLHTSPKPRFWKIAGW
jgi:hypothetical protein